GDGTEGTFDITDYDVPPPISAGKGMLQYVGQRSPRYAETGEYFLKGGADSPENFLAYYEFDDTKPTHHFAPHAIDYMEKGHTWKEGKGKNLFG
ncbi:hypothetical protein, partial [Klebsiella pneumoniae]|uniref:hypothetical protein n=1 Tax=Klebsiella pneumoniae TaxID=573 RepID=UPI00200ED072